MNMDQKNQYIEEYIKELARQINKQYNANIMDDDKINRGIEMFINSSEDLKTEIIPKINELAQKVIEDYLKFQKNIMEMMEHHQEEQIEELAILDLNADKNGIYLSQQQIDLLMIIDSNSKNELQDYFDNICGQFPYMKIDDVIPGFTTMHEEELESAKKILFQKYQDGLIGYLDNAQMSDVEKAEVKLKRLGINGEELEKCLKNIEDGKINETFNYLGQKYGDEFITKFNRSMNDDFENLKAASYDEIKSLSNLIKSDESLDSITIATGKYNNTVYSTPNGKVFDSYLTDKAAKYCFENGKHLRYHATFDHSHIDSLIERICKQHNIDLSNRSIDQLTPDEIAILKSHKNEVLEEQNIFTKMSLKHVEDLNKKYPGLITQYEVFNELVEKNKKDKNSTYEMVWEKYFGISVTDIMNCFKNENGNYIKPNGIEFMYNETTLTESPEKRKTVEKVMYQLDKEQPGFVDSFADQMHLSDEDVFTEEGRKNLTETAQMLKRFQDGKLIVDGKEERITPKKTECSEHDFHFTNPFLENTNKMQQSGQKVDLWQVKRKMQKYISNTYLKNGVKFDKTTYWNTIGQVDHNQVRTNQKIQKENKNRKQKGLSTKPLVKTMYAGLVPDGKPMPKTLKNKKQIKQQNNTISSQSKVDSSIQNRKNQLIKLKNEVIKMSSETNKTEQKQNSSNKVLKKTINTNKGFTNILILSLVTGFASGVITTIMYLIINN